MITVIPMTTRAELEGKAYVHHRAWQETYAGLVDADYLTKMTYEKCLSIAQRYPDNILVAKDGERVVGFTGYGAYRDGTLPDTGEVYSIYVLRAYQGQGVGYALMNAATASLRQYPRIALWVLRGNDRAIRFYERYGFVFDGTEAEILMGTPNTELRYILERSNETV